MTVKTDCYTRTLDSVDFIWEICSKLQSDKITLLRETLSNWHRESPKTHRPVENEQTFRGKKPFHRSVESQMKLTEGLNGGNSITVDTQFLWLCNMKQLNFRHFNTNSKKFSVAIFFPERNKLTSQKVNILCLVYHEDFCHFPTIPAYRRLTKMSEDYPRFLRTNLNVFDVIFVVIFKWEKKHFFAAYRFEFFQREKSLNM